MFCPSDTTSGLITLSGQIQQTDLQSITVQSPPLSISFGPRTTIPSLNGNRIVESTENTCMYRGSKFTLVDVQICSIAHEGFILPGHATQTPVAELILSFANKSNASDLSELSGVLLCVPIYESSPPDHEEYLTQLVDAEKTFSKNNTAFVPTLESLFVSQPSLGYKTCFETVDADKTPHAKSLQLFIFPKGVHLLPTTYQTLIARFNGLSAYQLPPVLRGADSTVKTFDFNESGTKVVKTTSQDGLLYKITVSSCTEEFKNRFQYFTMAPRIPGQKKDPSTDKGHPSYTTNQYKCMPFSTFYNITDNNYVSLKDMKNADSLDTVLQKEKDLENENILPSPTTDSTDSKDMVNTSIGIGIGVVVVGVIVGAVLSFSD
jgi:hypothetical protein